MKREGRWVRDGKIMAVQETTGSGCEMPHDLSNSTYSIYISLPDAVTLGGA